MNLPTRPPQTEHRFLPTSAACTNSSDLIARHSASLRDGGSLRANLTGRVVKVLAGCFRISVRGVCYGASLSTFHGHLMQMTNETLVPNPKPNILSVAAH